MRWILSVYIWYLYRFDDGFKVVLTHVTNWLSMGFKLENQMNQRWVGYWNRSVRVRKLLVIESLTTHNGYRKSYSCISYLVCMKYDPYDVCDVCVCTNKFTLQDRWSLKLKLYTKIFIVYGELINCIEYYNEIFYIPRFYFSLRYFIYTCNNFRDGWKIFNLGMRWKRIINLSYKLNIPLSHIP